MMSDIPILGSARRAKVHGLVEICRSFGWKLNVGNYESRDFFCSQKVECEPEDAAEVSERVYAFCKAQVIRSLNQYLKEAESNFGPSKEHEIDIGGNPPNSAAAAQYVAQQKIAAGQKRRTA